MSEGSHAIDGDIYLACLRGWEGADIEPKQVRYFILSPPFPEPNSADIPTKRFPFWYCLWNTTTNGRQLVYGRLPAFHNLRWGRDVCVFREDEFWIYEFVQRLPKGLCKRRHAIDRDVYSTLFHETDVTWSTCDSVAELRLIPSQRDSSGAYVPGEDFAFGRFKGSPLRGGSNTPRRFSRFRRTSSHAWFLARQRFAPRPSNTALYQDSPPIMAVKADSHMSRESVSLLGGGLKTPSNRMKPLRGFGVASIMGRGPLGPLSTHPADQRQRRPSRRLP